MEDVWTAYHECGHAIVAIASGCVGSIYIKGCEGAVKVERWSQPVGRRMEVYSTAGAVAEAMARNGFEDVAEEEFPLILNDVKSDVFDQYPPSAEDFEGIEALTEGLVDETFAFLAARWDSLVLRFSLSADRGGRV